MRWERRADMAQHYVLNIVIILLPVKMVRSIVINIERYLLREGKSKL